MGSMMMHQIVTGEQLRDQCQDQPLLASTFCQFCKVDEYFTQLPHALPQRWLFVVVVVQTTIELLQWFTIHRRKLQMLE